MVVMATRYSDALPQGLRYEPTPKRVRAEVAGEARQGAHGRPRAEFTADLNRDRGAAVSAATHSG